MKEVDNESIVEDVVSNSDESDISDSEADILETASKSDDEIASSESTEESEDGDLFIGKDGTGGPQYHQTCKAELQLVTSSKAK